MKCQHMLKKRKKQYAFSVGFFLGGIIFFIMSANLFLYKHLTKEIGAIETVIQEMEETNTGANTIIFDNCDEQKQLQKNERKENLQSNIMMDWKLLVVNPWNKLPDDFAVELTALNNGLLIDQRILPNLQEMMDDARAEGLNPVLCSAYRTNEKQTSLYLAKVQEYLQGGYTQTEAERKAAKWVAVPGYSEHQTGLALDIVSADYQMLDEKQADTKEQKWLMEHSWEYGFILRYPEDKEKITGICYEPWHYRYVGKTAAAKMYKSGWCLEEYADNNL